MNLCLRSAACLTGMLALWLSGYALSPHERSPLQEAEDRLPLAPIGGIPIEVVVTVDFDFSEKIGGDELSSHAGSWTHTQKGRLFRTFGWLSHEDRIEGARGSGRLICWYDWGQPAGTPHWTVQWSSELTLPEPGRRVSPTSFPLPPIHIDIDGADALVIYAPPREFGYWYPGSRDDCQNPDPVPAHQATGSVVFHLDEVDVERPPDADSSADLVIQDGIVLLHIPLDRLGSGTSERNAVNLSGTEGDVEWGLRVGLTLTSSPGGP
jgi:hypothetical protein